MTDEQIEDDALVAATLEIMIGRDDEKEDGSIVIHQIVGKRATIKKMAKRIIAAIKPRIVAGERERCAELERSVYIKLAANGPTCGCGNGCVPVGAYHAACKAFAAAIRSAAP